MDNNMQIGSGLSGVNRLNCMLSPGRHDLDLNRRSIQKLHKNIAPEESHADKSCQMRSFG